MTACYRPFGQGWPRGLSREFHSLSPQRYWLEYFSTGVVTLLTFRSSPRVSSAEGAGFHSLGLGRVTGGRGVGGERLADLRSRRPGSAKSS